MDNEIISPERERLIRHLAELSVQDPETPAPATKIRQHVPIPEDEEIVYVVILGPEFQVLVPDKYHIDLLSHDDGFVDKRFVKNFVDYYFQSTQKIHNIIKIQGYNSIGIVGKISDVVEYIFGLVDLFSMSNGQESRANKKQLYLWIKVKLNPLNIVVMGSTIAVKKFSRIELTSSDFGDHKVCLQLYTTYGYIDRGEITVSVVDGSQAVRRKPTQHEENLYSTGNSDVYVYHQDGKYYLISDSISLLNDAEYHYTTFKYHSNEVIKCEDSDVFVNKDDMWTLAPPEIAKVINEYYATKTLPPDYTCEHGGQVFKYNSMTFIRNATVELLNSL